MHELRSLGVHKTFVFKGDKPRTSSQIQEALNILNINDPRDSKRSRNLKKFLTPVVDCKANLNSILEDLQPNQFSVLFGNRVLRCTGNAIGIAVGLLECITDIRGSRIITMISGNCTYGPGKVVDEKLTVTIRSRQDIIKQNDKTKYMKDAIIFYEGLSARALEKGIIVDLFVSTFDQFWVIEMKSLFEKTGGYFIMTDIFQDPAFKENFKKLFTIDDQRYLKMAFFGKLNLFTSKDFKIKGCIGPCSSNKKKTAYCSNSVIRAGNTSEWNIWGIDNITTLSFYFDLINKTTNFENKNYLAFLQFQTKYQHSDGSTRIRVTTDQKFLISSNNIKELAFGFDLEASVVLIARYIIEKC